MPQFNWTFSNPEKAANIKIYFVATSDGTYKFRGRTANLVEVASYIHAFEEKYGDKVNDVEWIYKMMSSNDATESTKKALDSYLFYSYLLKENDIDADKLLEQSKNNPEFKAIMVILDNNKVKPGSDGMKTFFHEVELHVHRRLGLRKNPEGGQDGTGDHMYGFDFEKHKEYYKDNGYTQESLDNGKSPQHTIIHKDSPTGRTNSEIDKVQY